MKTITKFNLLSMIKLHGLMFGLAGLACGVLYSFGGLAIDSLVTLGILDGEKFGTPGLSYGTVLAFGALIGMPLIFAGAGVALGIIEGIFYNLYARMFGGMKADIDTDT